MTNHQSSISNHHSSWKWWVCGVLLLATFLNYMDRQALAVTLPELKHEFNLGERRIGMVEGCFGFAFAAGSLLFGLLADRFGPRRLYPVVLIGWSLAGIATGFAAFDQVTSWLEVPSDEEGAGTFRWLLIWRTMLGLFEAGHWPCALITAQRLLTAKDRPLGNAILQSGATFATILIPIYAEVVQRLGWGWPVVFWTIGVGGLLWVPLWLTLVKGADLDQRPGEGDDAVAEPPVDRGTFISRLAALAIIVTSLTISWQFLRAWLTLLLDFHGYDRLDARLATSGYFIAAEIGCLSAGAMVLMLVRRGVPVHRARVATYASFTALTAVAAIAPFVGTGWMMIAGLMVAGAGILGLHPLYYALIQELPRRSMGGWSGLLAAGGWVVSSVFQILIGARIQETKSYDVALVIAGLSPFIGLIAILTLWRSGRIGPDPR